MIFDLLWDCGEAVRCLPSEHTSSRILRLLEQVFRFEGSFLARHPTALFQCLWNQGWWYDSPEAARHYNPPLEGWPPEGPPWERSGPKLCVLLEQWRSQKEERTPGFVWLRSLHPPAVPLGGAQLACLRGHEDAVKSVAFDPQGRRIVSGSDDKTMRVWDAATGAELLCLRGHKWSVMSVAFDFQGRRIVSGLGDKTVRIWDAATGAELHRLGGHAGWVVSVAFDPQGRRIVSGSGDGMVRVWDAATGAELDCLRGQEHKYGVKSFAFDP